MSGPANFVAVETGECPFCNKPGRLWVLESVAAKVEEWKANPFGPPIQRAIPELYAWEREMLISGSHPDCFDEAFGDDDAS